jgi:diguanylate cyclase (GGDEF)-like protein
MSRQSDIIARFAGDEFVFILPGTTTQEAQAYINRLRSYFVDHKMDVGETQIEIGFS